MAVVNFCGNLTLILQCKCYARVRFCKMVSRLIRLILNYIDNIYYNYLDN